MSATNDHLDPQRPDAPVTVLMVDDHRALAEALALAMERHPEVRPVGVVGSAEAALAAVDELRPDVVLMDVVLPGMDGIECTRRIKARHPECRVMVLTGHVDSDVLTAALRAGASGFMPKDSSFADVIEAIVAPAGANILLGRQTLGAVIAEVTRGERARTSPRGRLTHRETEILGLLSQGQSPAAIARRLGITLHTCRGHIKSILAKLEVHSQLEAVVAAARSGLIDAVGSAEPPGEEPSGG